MEPMERCTWSCAMGAVPHGSGPRRPVWSPSWRRGDELSQPLGGHLERARARPLEAGLDQLLAQPGVAGDALERSGRRLGVARLDQQGGAGRGGGRGAARGGGGRPGAGGGTPPTAVATVGRPVAKASTSTCGKPSVQETCRKAWLLR